MSDGYPGRIYKLSLDGKVSGYLGKSGKMPGEFGWIRQIVCPSENTLYVAELLNWRVQKLEMKPQYSVIGPATILMHQLWPAAVTRALTAVILRFHPS